MTVIAINKTITPKGVVYTINLDDNNLPNKTRQINKCLIGNIVNIEFNGMVEVRNRIIVDNKMLQRHSEFEHTYIGLLV